MSKEEEKMLSEEIGEFFNHPHEITSAILYKFEMKAKELEERNKENERLRARCEVFNLVEALLSGDRLKVSLKVLSRGYTCTTVEKGKNDA